jgi:dihydroorotase (multifunctional complex type)
LFDLALHGRAYVGEVADRWVFIKGGVIAKVSSEPVGRAAATVELGRDQILIPGATDLHVHLRDWSQAEKETVETGTKSALVGGVTTVAEMPNTVPSLGSPELVEARADLLRHRSYADFAIHAAPPSAASEFAKLKKAGAFGLKVYPPDLPRFETVLRGARAAGLKVAVHAEEESMVFSDRPAGAELVAVRKVLEQVGRRSQVRFAHLSTWEAAREVVESKRTHSGLTIEVAPHHLFIDRRTAAARIGAASKVNPPLRSLANSRAMVRLLGEGVFDFYATDHAPHTLDDKLTKGAPGFPGLEIALPLFLTRTENLGLACRMFCQAPAAYLGLKKGRVHPGYFADLAVLSRRRWTVDPSRFVSKGRVTPFAGEELRYAVDHVFLRGSTVYDEGRFVKQEALLVN